MVLFGEWFEFIVSEPWGFVVFVCRSIYLYDGLVVNGTSNPVLNIPSRHGC